MLALTVPRNACRGRGPNKEQQAATPVGKQ